MYHYAQPHYTMACEHAVWLLQLLDDETREHQVEVNRDLMCSDPIQLAMAEPAAWYVVDWYKEAHGLLDEEAADGSPANVE